MRLRTVLMVGLVVLVIVFAAWWFWPGGGQCGQYDDVKTYEDSTHIEYWSGDHPYESANYVEIQNMKQGDTWKLMWRQSGTSVYTMGGLTFEQIPGVISGYIDDSEQREVAKHIWNAIDSGCV